MKNFSITKDGETTIARGETDIWTALGCTVNDLGDEPKPSASPAPLFTAAERKNQLETITQAWVGEGTMTDVERGAVLAAW